MPFIKFITDLCKLFLHSLAKHLNICPKFENISNMICMFLHQCINLMIRCWHWQNLLGRFRLLCWCGDYCWFCKKHRRDVISLSWRFSTAPLPLPTRRLFSVCCGPFCWDSYLPALASLLVLPSLLASPTASARGECWHHTSC